MSTPEPPPDDLVVPEFEPDTTRRLAVRRIASGLVALLAVIALGVLGYLLLGWSLSDAIYMVAITVSGVGFGEVHPLNALERAHTILLISFGVVAVGYTAAGLVQFVTEGEIQRLLGHQRVRRQIENLSDHTIVAGFGRMGNLICSELESAGMEFILIDRDPGRVSDIERRGWLYVLGDATEEKVLQEARLERAQALITAMPSDADNVFITLTARQLAPDVQILARAEQPSTEKKLIQAGANHVVLPASIGAHRIASLLTNPSAVKFAELVTHRSSLAIEMADFPVTPGGLLVGLTLRDADIGRRTGVIVVAVKRADGSVEFPPTGDQPFSAGDSIVLIGRHANLEQFRTAFHAGTGRESESRPSRRPKSPPR